MDTKSGKKINSYPNFWKVCGFSYSSITSSQSYKCQQKLLPCEFMERAYKNYRKGSSVTGRIAPACKSSLRITRCKKSGRLGKGGCMLNYGNVWGIITCDKIFSVMLVLLPIRFQTGMSMGVHLICHSFCKWAIQYQCRRYYVAHYFYS